MVRLSRKAAKKTEETAALVNGGSPNSGPGIFSRYFWHLMWVILLGCLALFIWDSMEWDEQTGDVQIKLLKGNKQDEDASVPTPEEELAAEESNGGGSSDVAQKTVEEQAKEKQPPPPATPPPTEAPKVATEAPKPPPPPPPATETTPAATTPATTPAPPAALSAECQQQCASATADPARFDGADLTLAANMRTRLQTHRQKWIDQFMKVEYGDYYENIFEPMDETTNTRVHVGKMRAWKPPNMLNLPNNPSTHTDGAGWHRMVRKYTIKLLQVQLGMLEEKLNPVGYCQTQCQPPSEAHKMNDKGLYARFTWVNGGHSASAGHGNFYRESYTANLGRDVAPILKEIGLDWQVRNYAMGGTDSGEEVALCHNSIFGKDVDSLSWDYGMTDGHDSNKMTLYAYRTARLSQLADQFSQPGNIRHRPSLIGIHHQDFMHDVLQSMQSLGMTVLGMDWHFEKDVVEPAFPDMFGMSEAQIQETAPSVRYFKCQEKIEAGEPGCNDHKYNETMCQQRKAKASWHPGVKYHALIGHLLSFTVLEIFDQALEAMAAQEPAGETDQAKYARIKQQLATLDAQEQTDYDKIFQTPVPANLAKFFDQTQWKAESKEKDKAEMMAVPNFLEWFIKDPTFCHTAMLPAEIRYKGYLTENFDMVGTVLDEHFEKAHMQTLIAGTEDPPPVTQRQAVGFQDPKPERAQMMVLAAKDDERDHNCPVQTNVDVKDYFYISKVEDWRWLKLPNDAEKAYYTEFDAAKSHGYIFICMSKCDWGRCPKGDIRDNVMKLVPDQEFGGITMEVNLVKVTSMNCMWLCCALKHDDPDPKHQFVWTPTAEGKYEFRAKISGGAPDAYSYARFSSFILL